MGALINIFDLDPATLREAEEDDDGMVLFGTGQVPDDFLVIEMPLSKFNTLGRPERLSVTITPR